MQLERLLQSQGFGTRKICRALIRAGRVTVADTRVADPFAEFPTDNLSITIDGAEWLYREKACLLLNKPAGYECSRAPRHHPSVLSLLPEPLRTRGVQPVGRLDEDTTGLLLLSDDGQFIHRLTSPKHKIDKIYEVTAKHPVDDAQIAALLAGVQLHDEPAPIAAAACTRVSEQVIHLTLTEGKYHQVKRMVAAAGNRVKALKRIAVGSVTLGDELAEGKWRWLDADEVAALSGAQPTG
jgi:16S rRNA pseudouridine516 synthase